MIEIRTTFTPFKMKISRREPVVLSVEIRTPGKETEIVSLDVDLGQWFSFEKTGFKNKIVKNIPEFKAGDKEKFYYDVWPKQMLRAGEHGIKLTTIEHYQGFNYVKRKHEKVLKLSVED